MRVVDQRKPQTVSFGALNSGDVFYDVNDTDCFFMKVNTAHNDVNAICLHDGEAYEFDDGEYVEIINAELVARN